MNASPPKRLSALKDMVQAGLTPMQAIVCAMPTMPGC